MRRDLVRETEWAWEMAGYAAMTILEGSSLCGEPPDHHPTAEEAAVDPDRCISVAGTVALRIAGKGGYSEAHRAVQERIKRILLALDRGERDAEQIVRQKLSTARKRLRENWAGVEAIARLLPTRPGPSPARIREAFSAAMHR